ncbi:plasmid recombination protein [Eshraghiella crossota]|uniref:plasmid recombination protein n=1 Tax=Eshraghiella crossota TaxID=45851 RepID=UPI003AB13321
MERTISAMIGKGSVNHNTRAFTAKNVDKNRSADNVEFCQEDIKQVYHKLFDEARERYNAKQKRKDRMIDNYYEKIRRGKQEKLFHEVIFQIGNKDDMNAKNEEGLLAKRILTEFMDEFQARNPNLYVFSAHLHMDEETPHLHIDFVPYITGSKRGLDTRVSLKSALAAEGFTGGTRGATELNQWIASEKQEIISVVAQLGEEVSVKKQELQNVTIEKELAEEATQKANEERTIAQQEKEVLLAGNQNLRMENTRLESRKDRLRMENHDLKQKQLQLQTDNEELEQRHEDLQYKNSELQNVNDQLFADNHTLEQKNDSFQSDNQALRQKYNDLQQNNVQLEKQQNELKSHIEQMVQSEQLLQRDVRKYDEAPEWQLPEPGAFASAKSFRDKVVIPFVNKLKSLIKNLTIQCVRLKEEVLQLKKEKKRLSDDVEFYKGKIKDMSDRTELLQEKADDLERVKRYAGAEQIDTIIRKVKEQERTEQQIRRYERSYGTR